MLDAFTDQQARFDRAFCHGGTSCSTTCEACGRTYFVTSPGHGDYEPGEIERYRKLAEEQPDKYIEVADFCSVSDMDFEGRRIVIGCLCDPTKKYSEWIEKYASELTEYLRLFWSDRLKKAQRVADESRSALLALLPQDGKGEWQLMDTAPKNATWVEVVLPGGASTCLAHWASDLSGEEQPKFQGWFRRLGDHFRKIIPPPIAWRPETIPAATADGGK